ncbi:MAG TPA: Ig-like domain-containing protein [Longimicrobium sp.]|jgi:hypothetical protein
MFRNAGKWFPVALLAIGMAACDESPVTLPDLPEATSFASTPAEIRLVVGGTATIPAQVLDQNGQVMTNAQAVFVSQDPSVATVDASGTVRAVSPGTTNITATFGQVTATTRIIVARNESAFIRTLDVAGDSVVIDVNSPPVELLVRSFTAGGVSTCPNLTITATDRTVANVTQGFNPCRLIIRGNFPGRTMVTVSAEGVSDSVRVIVAAANSRANFVNPVTQAQAGSTVPYTVRVTDEAGNPIAGTTVNFDVTAGRLSATSVVTDANGNATVQYTLPTNLRDAGSFQTISFATTLPNGAAITRSVSVNVTPGPTATLTLQLLADQFSGNATPITGSSISARVNTTLFIGATGEDQFGNRTNEDLTFAVTPPAVRTCGDNFAFPPGGGPAIEYTCIRSSTTGTSTFTATRPATGSQPAVSRSVSVVFTP